MTCRCEHDGSGMCSPGACSPWDAEFFCTRCDDYYPIADKVEHGDVTHCLDDAPRCDVCLEYGNTEPWAATS